MAGRAGKNETLADHLSSIEDARAFLGLPMPSKRAGKNEVYDACLRSIRHVSVLKRAADRTLAEATGFSRSSIRSALRRLVARGARLTRIAAELEGRPRRRARGNPCRAG